MGHRSGIDHPIIRPNKIHVCKIAKPHREKIAMRDLHALGSTRCATGVKKPCSVIRLQHSRLLQGAVRVRNVEQT